METKSIPTAEPDEIVSFALPDGAAAQWELLCLCSVYGETKESGVVLDNATDSREFEELLHFITFISTLSFSFRTVSSTCLWCVYEKQFAPFDSASSPMSTLLKRAQLCWPPPSWDSKGCYLTRSMTLSRGASLTVSSLMAKIWSPGRSLPKEGPSADNYRHTASMQRHKQSVKMNFSIEVLITTHTHTHTLTSRDGAYNDRPLTACNEAEAFSRVALDGDLSCWGRT